MYFDWNISKNKQLMNERGVCFEMVISAINEGKLHDILEHKNQKKYLGQKLFIVEIDEYAYLVPFVVNGDEVFLKTIIPNRQATKNYLK